jgi:hypothetical protein
VELRLRLHPGTFAICRLDPDAPAPEWAERGPFRLACRTADELALVVEERWVAPGVLELVGPFPFTAVGVLLAALQPLAAAGISILATSTFDTDYVLFPDDRRAEALAALREAGHEIESRTP